MKIINENITNFDSIKEPTITIDPVTADALVTDDESKENYEKIIYSKVDESKPEFGADKQEKPKKVEVPDSEIKLEEAWFDDIEDSDNEIIQEIKNVQAQQKTLTNAITNLYVALDMLDDTDFLPLLDGFSVKLEDLFDELALDLEDMQEKYRNI